MSMGKTASILATGVFLFSIGRALPHWASGDAGPRVIFTPTEVDLGDVRVGILVHQIFVLRNSGYERLLITDVKSTCQCTVADLASRAVPPGGVEELKVTFKASKAGTKDQRVIVRTNDPSTPVYVLKLKARAVGMAQPTSQTAGGA